MWNFTIYFYLVLTQSVWNVSICGGRCIVALTLWKPLCILITVLPDYSFAQHVFSRGKSVFPSMLWNIILLMRTRQVSTQCLFFSWAVVLVFGGNSSTLEFCFDWSVLMCLSCWLDGNREAISVKMNSFHMYGRKRLRLCNLFRMKNPPSFKSSSNVILVFMHLIFFFNELRPNNMRFPVFCGYFFLLF